MGTRVPPKPPYYEIGVDCPTCTPSLYKTGEWPRYMYATFYDITPCPGHPAPPNGYTFKIAQQDLVCEWRANLTLSGVTYRIWLDLSDSYLMLHELTPTYRLYFHGESTPCKTYFPTNLSYCPTWSGFGGRAIVRPTPAAIPSILTGHYNFMPWQQTMFELQKVAVDHTLCRLARKQDHTRCYFYIDDEDLP